VINISLSDLLKTPETAPIAPTRSGDAAAFTGLLDQFDRHQAEVAAKPSRPRAERATAAAQDDEQGKSTRSKAPVDAKAKPAATAERDIAATDDDAPIALESNNASAGRTRDATTSEQAADDNGDQTADAFSPQMTVPATVTEEPPATQLSLATQAGTADDELAGIAANPTYPAADNKALTDAGDALAAAPNDKADQKVKAPTPQMQTTDNSTIKADDVQAQTAQTNSAATAQAADLSKRLEAQPMQVAVQLGNEEAPKPLNLPVSLANGMSHPAQTEAATTTQTAAAISATNGAAAATTTANGVQGATLATKPAPLPHPATEQVAVHIAKASAEGVDKINVKLKPASLGHVDVQLDIAADGRVQVVVSADRADTLNLLQRDARGLERALNDAGLQMDQQSLSFNLRDQGLPQGNAGNEPTGRMGWQGGSEGADEPDPAIGGYLNARAAVGGVDIRV
jgi:flagellar hook-length control protein FliK